MPHNHTMSGHPQAEAGAASAGSSQNQLLARWAARYIWWKTAQDALRYPDRIIAQVMNIGDYDDVQTLVDTFGEEALREVVRHAEAGMFNERSWAYWHYRLGLVSPDVQEKIPPLPARRFS